MSESPGAPTFGPGCAAALLAVPLAALVAVALGGPILSGDLWWHLRTGAWILEQGALPATDPFSHTAGDTPWVLQEYGSQVLFAAVYRVAGFDGLRVLSLACGLAVLVAAWNHGRRRLEPIAATGALAVFAVSFALKWELRPHLLSAVLFFALWSILFRRDVPGRREVALTFVLSCAWVQLHAEALLAPILGAAALVGAVVTRDGARIRAWAAVFVASLVGTLVSPLGWEPHWYAVVGREAPKLYIEEWFRPWVLPGDPRFAPLTVGVFATYAGSVLVGALALARAPRGARTPSRSQPSWEELGALAVCLLLALQARRFLWLTWPAVVVALSQAAPLLRGQAARVAPWCTAAAVVGASWLLAGTHYVHLSWASGNWRAITSPELFPESAADFVAECELEGNLFHRYEWGGYLGFRLGARNPVYIDGRTVLFEQVIPERWKVERWRALGDAEFARRTLDERDVEILVLPRLVDHGSGYVPWAPPDASSTWSCVWRGTTANVWIRRDGPNMQRVLTHFRDLGVPFDPAVGIVEADVLRARSHWTDRVLPPSVRGELEPLYRGSDWLSVGAAVERARVYAERRMRRNARSELAWAIGEHYDGDEERRHLALLESDGPETYLRAHPFAEPSSP